MATSPIADLWDALFGEQVVILDRPTYGIDDETFVDACATRLRELGGFLVESCAYYTNDDDIAPSRMTLSVQPADEAAARQLLED